jgi:hypothetical protein
MVEGFPSEVLQAMGLRGRLSGFARYPQRAIRDKSEVWRISEKRGRGSHRPMGAGTNAHDEVSNGIERSLQL